MFLFKNTDDFDKCTKSLMTLRVYQCAYHCRQSAEAPQTRAVKAQVIDKDFYP